MMATQVSGADTWLTLNGVPLRFQEGEEHLDAHVLEYAKNEFEITKHAPYPLNIFVDQELLETKKYGYWQWKPVTYAGLYTIRVTAPGYSDQQTTVRVIPQHLTQPLYKKMQEELSTFAIDLLFRLNSPASEYVQSTHRFQEHSLLQDYQKIKHIMRKLQPILVHIRKQPYKTLTKRQEERFIHELTSISDDSLAIDGDYTTLQRNINSSIRYLHVPVKWTVQQATISYDVYENRLLKQFLRQHLITKLTMIEQSIEKEVKRSQSQLAFKQKYDFSDAQNIADEIALLQKAIQHCQQMKQQCWNWSREFFLQDVSQEAILNKATQILLKHPYYGHFYQLYLQFQQQFWLSLDTEKFLTTLNTRKIPDLYEMWSVFFITQEVIQALAKEGYTITSSTLFYEIEKNYFQFDVKKNTASIILEKKSTKVRIIYEPIYPNKNSALATGLIADIGRDLPLKPDMSIEVYRGNTPESVIIFDAKYKVEKDINGYYYPLRTDLDKMQGYAANIQYKWFNSQRRKTQLKRIVSSAFVLYPGNKVYSESGGSIGGLPLRPGASERLLKDIREQLDDILYRAYLIE